MTSASNKLLVLQKVISRKIFGSKTIELKMNSHYLSSSYQLVRRLLYLLNVTKRIENYISEKIVERYVRTRAMRRSLQGWGRI